LEYLLKKDKPFDYIDTHAGAGVYKLASTMSSKNAEYKTGISHFWPNGNTHNSVIQKYIEAVASFNKTNELKFYPGSPAIANFFLRHIDKAWLYELHPADIELLEQQFGDKRRIKVRQEDGFNALPSLLPTQSRRAFILIDPPYELKGDYHRVIDSVKKSHKRMPGATFAIWYPVVDRKQIGELHRRLKHSGIKNIAVFELGIKADEDGRGMTSSGMIVINPPWTLFESMQQTLPVLAKTICKEGEGIFKCEQLVAE
jgi:23S rRNA (adenine2030-N6)-methyltransferase